MISDFRLMRRLIVALAGVLSWLVLVGDVRGQVRYTVTDLGALGELTGSNAYGINAHGDVVGRGDFGGHAFLYSNGRMTDLGTLGGTTSIAYGINDKKEVVGWSMTTGNAHMHAFLYRDGKMIDLGTLGGESSEAKAINAKGQVVGWSHTSGAGETHAFLYSEGKMTNLGPILGGSSTIATAISPTGQIVGAIFPTKYGEIHALFYDGTRATDLGTLGGRHGTADGINSKGQVVGMATIKNNTAHAFLYGGGKMTDLGTLGGVASWAFGINAKGEIVGRTAAKIASDNQDPGWRAFLHSSGKTTDLNDLIAPASGWTLQEATAINDKGQIVGSGINPKGRGRAFLLTPVSKPQTAPPPPTDN